MQTITKTTTTDVYKFYELSEEAKKNALDKNRYINVDYDDWYHDDGLLELSSDEIKQSKIKLSKKWYEIKPQSNIPGEYPAYSGLFKWKNVYFSTDYEWYIQFEDLAVQDDNIFRKFLKIPKRLWQNLYYRFETNTYIRHADTELNIYPDKLSQKDFTEKELIIIEKAQNIMNNKIKEALDSISNHYDYMINDDSIIETIEANNYDFTVEGEIY